MSKNRRNDTSQDQGETPTGGWEVVYSGFVLILLCFFIMLCSFSSMEEAKVMRFVKSFANAVSILPGGLDFESGKEVLPPSPDIVDMESRFAKLFGDLRKLTCDLGLEGDVNLSFSKKGLVMRLSDTFMFDLGVAEILPEAIPLLKKLAFIISKTSYPVCVEGHTDNLPIHTEKFPSNWELSTARAVNILRYFTENEKIPMQGLSAVGFGEFQPIFANDSPEHRAKNRRVEIVFVREKHEQTSLAE
ncbi:MAG: flagellar motor protein MotB [Desulfobacterales bacterium]|nr:flagellar motor protein MotB [Desulfobacterales bacterium]MDL1986743.1 flagellar motor protein MotB [Deltaproteobacteria bacterium]